MEAHAASGKAADQEALSASTAQPPPLTASAVDGSSSAAPAGSQTLASADALRQKLKPQQHLGQRKDGSRPVDIYVGGHAHAINPTSSPGSQGSLDPSSPPRLPANVGAGRRSSSPFGSAASPGRFMRSSNSPRHLSPATSQIFERDVQEPAVQPSELSPAIPSHITTEDHIPPVLEASSLAITDKQLGPDEVEIVRHNAHVPAAITVASSSMSDSHPSMLGVQAELAPAWEPSAEETGSTYGAVDPMDPRRLSFISFADIVNADHQEVTRESQAPSMTGVRSSSPLRSPLSSLSARNSPPMSVEVSPTRGGGGPASISSGHGGHNEITIETMRQTLQKTGGSDVSGLVSQPLSATSTEDVPRPLR